MTDRIHFNKKAVENLPVPPQGKRAYYHDTKVNGLLVCVTSTEVKSFQVYRKVNNKPVRVTLGRFPDLTVKQARKKAQDALSQLADGINPVAEKRALKARSITLGEVFEDYLKARKSLKPGTVKDYRNIMRQAFSDWLNKPLAAINRDEVANRHHKFGKQSEARANNAMRVLRALFNFAASEYEDEYGAPLFPDNPVTRISHTKAWYRVERRRTVIKTHELKSWFEGVSSLESEYSFEQTETVRDYLLLLLFTGLRREEGARLLWSRVDLEGRTLTITDTKNGEPHTLPLSDYLYALLTRRQAKAKGPYVFPSATSKTGHLINPYKPIEKVRERSGIYFTLHDLRRTFITIAEGLDISSYAVKRLVNHKMRTGVTAGYIVSDVERLRKPMQAITDFILSAADIRRRGEVIPLDVSRGTSNERKL